MANGNAWIILLLLAGVPILYIIYLLSFFCWYHYSTRGVSYFGKQIEARRKYKEKIHKYGRLAMPFFEFLGPKISKPNVNEFSHNGIHAPYFCCTPKTFRKAIHYQPQTNDVFVATPIKCGTTWMQQIVYEVLSHGHGDLSDNGHNHLYAMSPWIESFNSVDINNAPLIGEKEKRIIKTHLPANLCPYNEDAKYIYITRHPVSCFMSFVDFSSALAGPFASKIDQMVNWFCSDQFWWGSWPDHVEKYWQWSKTKSNVIFFHFEELKEDLLPIINRVAEFLDCELADSEVSETLKKCSFSYMKDHEEWLEMTPPSPFSAGNTFFKSGSSKRHHAIDTNHREKIAGFCREKLDDASYPIELYYPDIKRRKA